MFSRCVCLLLLCASAVFARPEPPDLAGNWRGSMTWIEYFNVAPDGTVAKREFTSSHARAWVRFHKDTDHPSSPARLMAISLYLPRVSQQRTPMSVTFHFKHASHPTAGTIEIHGPFPLGLEDYKVFSAKGEISVQHTGAGDGILVRARHLTLPSIWGDSIRVDHFNMTVHARKIDIDYECTGEWNGKLIKQKFEYDIVPD